MVKDNNGKVYKRGFTHGLSFHLDEVLATAVLRRIDPNFEVERQVSRKDPIPNEVDVLVFDIGRGTYDHHMNVGDGLFDGDHKHAACGLILRDFYEAAGISKETYKKLGDFFRSIEDVDNGVDGAKNFLSNMVGFLNPTQEELSTLSEDEKTALYNKRFEEAVVYTGEYLNQKIYSIENPIEVKNDGLEIARDSLRNLLFSSGNTLPEIIENSSYFEEDIKKRLISKFEKIEENKEIFDSFVEGIANRKILEEGFRESFNGVINKTIELAPYEEKLEQDFKEKEVDTNYLVIKEPGPWVEFVIEELNEKKNANIDFVIFKSSRDEMYMVQCVPPDSDHLFAQRVPMPEVIRGLSNQGEATAERDAKILDSFSSGIVFAHPGGFLAGTRTLDDAKNLVEKATEVYKELCEENNNKIELVD